jgi:hypothetical protein
VETDNGEKVENVCQRREWRHIIGKKGQKCVSEVLVETHYEEKKPKMCLQGKSGDR